MAIATTIQHKTVFGDMKVHYGKAVLSGGSSSGDVVTGLGHIDHMQVTPEGSAEKGCAINETFPLASGDATVVMESANLTFYWMAIGK